MLMGQVLYIYADGTGDNPSIELFNCLLEENRCLGGVKMY
jgi:hypothetical protein